MRWRLFQRLQKAVEGVARKHVHFVDNVDLVTGKGRGILHALDDFADIIDTRMGGSVHLDDIDMATFHDCPAMFALCRKINGRLVNRGGLVIEGAGKDARRCGLSYPAHTCQHVGLGNAASLERIGQGADHRLLADQVIKILRAVFARQNPVCIVLGHLASFLRSAPEIHPHYSGGKQRNKPRIRFYPDKSTLLQMP